LAKIISYPTSTTGIIPVLLEMILAPPQKRKIKKFKKTFPPEI